MMTILRAKLAGICHSSDHLHRARLESWMTAAAPIPPPPEVLVPPQLTIGLRPSPSSVTRWANSSRNSPATLARPKGTPAGFLCRERADSRWPVPPGPRPSARSHSQTGPTKACDQQPAVITLKDRRLAPTADGRYGPIVPLGCVREQKMIIREQPAIIELVGSSDNEEPLSGNTA
jgi:hypothetical protein